jgi:hypothetical protein
MEGVYMDQCTGGAFGSDAKRVIETDLPLIFSVAVCKQRQESWRYPRR